MAKEDHLRAAQLLAAAEAIREQANAPMMGHERAEYDAAMAALNERLEPATLESAWTDGRRLTTDEAVALALAAL